MQKRDSFWEQNSLRGKACSSMRPVPLFPSSPPGEKIIFRNLTMILTHTPNQERTRKGGKGFSSREGSLRDNSQGQKEKNILKAKDVIRTIPLLLSRQCSDSFSGWRLGLSPVLLPFVFCGVGVAMGVSLGIHKEEFCFVCFYVPLPL